MLYALGRWCFRARKRVLTGWLLALLVIGLAAGVSHGKFLDEFKIPGAKSQAALDQLYMTFPEVSGTRATLLVVAAPGQTVDDPAIKEPLERGLTDLSKLDYVQNATSPFDPIVKGMINPGRSAAMGNVMLRGSSSEITEAQREQLQQHARDIGRTMPVGTQVSMGGDAFSVEVPSISPVELVGLGIAVVVLFGTFLSALAGILPVVTAVWGVAIAMALVFGATGVTTISSSTPMLALMLGIAVGIDYALFILSRYRDELQHGLETEEAAARSVGTAGSAVVFAGLTVIIALVGLGIAGIPFLALMGIFAAIAVAVAVLIALTLLPAFMGFAGERLRPRKAPRTPDELDEEQRAHAYARRRRGPSGWWVRTVTKAPLVTVLVVVIGLSALSVPALDLKLSLPNSGQHTATAPDRITFDLIDQQFGPGYNGPLIVTADIIQSTDPLDLVDKLKGEIERMPGVAAVPMATPNRNADTGFIQVVPTTGPTADETKDLVEALRAKAPEWQDRYGVDTAVTGMTAVQIDISSLLGGALLPFGIFVVGLSLVLLTMVFRSLAVPIKATIGFLLSVGTAFGATALVFNDGFARSVINLEKPQPVISFYPILLMGILFGLAMDYEVFLVSRMREEYVHGKPASRAIRDGFVGSAKVVVAAALIMVSVFAFFVPQGEGPIKPIAFGLAIGVGVDAFLIRMTLVPAVMEILGDKAWWLPRWLDERLPTFDVEGESLAHMLALKDWPSPDADFTVVTEAMSVRAHGGRELMAPVDLALRPGEALVVEGPIDRRTPLLYGLAGRLPVLGGKVKVAQLVLPEQRADVRRRVAFIDCLHGDRTRLSVREEIAHAQSNPKVAVIIIDGADALPSHDERAAVASLIEESATGPCVILGVGETALVSDMIHRGFYTIELIPPVARPARRGLDDDSNNPHTLQEGVL